MADEIETTISTISDGSGGGEIQIPPYAIIIVLTVVVVLVLLFKRKIK